MSERITITMPPVSMSANDAQGVRKAVARALREMSWWGPVNNADAIHPLDAALVPYRDQHPVRIPDFTLPHRVYWRVLANFPALDATGDDGTLAYLIALGLDAYERGRAGEARP